MITYECNQCGMTVKATCGTCGVRLENGFLSLDNGTEVQISQCPSCEGKIKSPQCCGADMSCEV
jgi:DNA-directed RNA polymerase subunit RPC12/RpoP